MKEAFIKLHLSVLIAGGTGIFGRLITLNEGLLVWYRMLLAGVLFLYRTFSAEETAETSCPRCIACCFGGTAACRSLAVFSMAVSRHRMYLSGWSVCR